MRKDLEINEIADGVYRLNEFDSSNCYLVVGNERALLIDCGLGFCDIEGAVRDICTLPLTVCATHGHVDHIGGASFFPEVYVHREDCKALNRLQLSRIMRKLFLAGNGAVRAHGFGARDVKNGKYKPKLIPIEDGHAFDLGGRTVTVHHTPGHSRGSIALIDEKAKIIFSGDNVCDALWMHLPGRTSLDTWLPSAKWLYEKSAEYRIFWGHRIPELRREYIKTVIGWGEEIIRSQKRNTLLPKTKQYPAQSDGIIYKTNTVHGKD